MTEDELKAIDKRLADMSERVDAVIAKESRGKPMPVLDFKPRSMPAAARSRHKAKYVPLPIEPYDVGNHFVVDSWTPPQEGSIEQIFADFERQFDEMAQAHRQRGGFTCVQFRPRYIGSVAPTSGES